jgi:hypothetical protein
MLAYFGANIAQGLPRGLCQTAVSAQGNGNHPLVQDKIKARSQAAARRIESLAPATRNKEQAPAP